MPEFGQFSAVGVVLLLLAASLWLLRRKGHARFGFRTAGAQSARQLQSIERLPLTSQHSLHLIRVYGRTVLIAVSPGGCSVLDGSAWTTGTEERTALR